MKLILVVFFCFCYYIGYSQNDQVKVFDSTSYSTQTDSLRELYTFNKQIPEKYELSILLALSYFPELDSSKIIFKEARIKTTLNARPTILTLLFRKNDNRKYIVRINTKQKDSLVTLDEVPFNARIGLFAHEFCHFIDYRKKSIFGVIRRLFSYTNRKGKERFEKEIDLMTIQRGLGWQLYAWSYFVLNKSEAKHKYKEFKKQIYLEPNEILKIIKRSSNY